MRDVPDDIETYSDEPAKSFRAIIRNVPDDHENFPDGHKNTPDKNSRYDPTIERRERSRHF
jgi:hypothetical protein